MPPNTLLTTARAIRAARQYFGEKSVLVRERDTEFLFHGPGNRVVRFHQETRGTVSITEENETDTFVLPPVGPLDFNRRLP